ncbi:MAG TPA: TIGR04283 family arsenosugar biosynthesis glycosyltransferase [Verrucomicrobiae bacterium]|nr:TIGR04283 family arsenosugar biosynthesis glycosyltransferase [Verrucomicrobiae bacterium]
MFREPVPRLLSISVVIPTWNEATELRETVRRARLNPEITELIVTDGGSDDGTTVLAAELGCRVLTGCRGRGAQLRLGAASACGEVVLCLHADTWLPDHAGRAITTVLRDPRVVGGGFWKVFRGGSWVLRGSRARCALRFWMGRLLLGDQAIFVRRAVLERIGGMPDLPLMEEFELCRRLRREGRLALAPATVSTSARRFEKFGVWGTYWRMIRVTVGYWLGVPVERLQQIYEAEPKTPRP